MTREPIYNCGQPIVLPVADKFMCQSCDQNYDRLQDGHPGYEG